MAERHELTLTLLVTAEEEETVIAMLNHYGFQFKKIGELEFSVLDNNQVSRIRSKERGYMFYCRLHGDSSRLCVVNFNVLGYFAPFANSKLLLTNRIYSVLQ